MSWDSLPPKYQTEDKGTPEPITLEKIQRRQRGLQNRKNGEIFENLIEESLKWYKRCDLADVQKTPEPMKPLRAPNKRGQFLACYTKAAQPDFKGTLIGGRSVVFEAKHSETDRITQSAVTEEQAERLENHHHLGAAAFVLVSLGLQDYYRVPWEVWRDMKTIYGHKHMKRNELEPYRVKYIAGVIKLLDLLELEYNENKNRLKE